MDILDQQRLLVASGYYNGRVDGILGPQTIKAAHTIVARHPTQLTGDPGTWSDARLVVAACQLILLFAGHEPGAIDGLVGHNTREAYASWFEKTTTGKVTIVPRTPVKGYQPVKGVFPNQAGMSAFYGKPGLPGSKEERAMQARLVSFDLPFAFRLDYDRNTPVRSIRLHELCVVSAEAAINEAIRHYGRDEFVRLELDCFAGGYNPRHMRGGKSFSVHAYGAATDWSAAKNGLHMRAPQAQFSSEVYKAYFDIWEAYGWTSLGRAIGRDWMHIQAGAVR